MGVGGSTSVFSILQRLKSKGNLGFLSCVFLLCNNNCMGNHLQCSNYYCQSVILKPDWISESCWSISYKYLDNESENNSSIKPYSVKPYSIDRGVIHFDGKKSYRFLCSKECSLTYENFENIHIPIYISGKMHSLSKNNWKMYIFIGFKNMSLNDFESQNSINNIKKSFIGIQLEHFKKKCLLTHSFDNTIHKWSWDNKHAVYFPIRVEKIVDDNEFSPVHKNSGVDFENGTNFEIKEQILLNRENIHSETYGFSLHETIKPEQKVYIHICVEFDKGRTNFFTGEEFLELAIE